MLLSLSNILLKTLFISLLFTPPFPFACRLTLCFIEMYIMLGHYVKLPLYLPCIVDNVFNKRCVFVAKKTNVLNIISRRVFFFHEEKNCMACEGEPSAQLRRASSSAASSQQVAMIGSKKSKKMFYTNKN